MNSCLRDLQNEAVEVEPIYIAGLILLMGAFGGIWFFSALVGISLWGYIYGEFVHSLRRMKRFDAKNASKEERRLIREAEKRAKE